MGNFDTNLTRLLQIPGARRIVVSGAIERERINNGHGVKGRFTRSFQFVFHL